MMVASSSPRSLPIRSLLRCLLLLMMALSAATQTAHAQAFRFDVRAEPDIIPANGISTASILVQVQDTGDSGITSAPLVRFNTTQGSIEGQARLTGGVARVLLRSTTTPGTALVTVFIGSAREQIAVEFTNEEVGLARYLQVSGPYVAYGAQTGIITASGVCALDFGDTRIESSVRLDVDLQNERVWAEGHAGEVLIRHGRGANMHQLRGDRLFYDLRRRRGVIRRVDSSLGPQRQEFMDSDFRALPANQDDARDPDAPTISSLNDPVSQGPAIPLPDAATLSTPSIAAAPANHPAPETPTSTTATGETSSNAAIESQAAPPQPLPQTPPPQQVPQPQTPAAPSPLTPQGAPAATGTTATGTTATGTTATGATTNPAADTVVTREPISILEGRGFSPPAGLQTISASAADAQGGVKLALVEPRTPSDNAPADDNQKTPDPVPDYSPVTPAPAASAPADSSTPSAPDNDSFPLLPERAVAAIQLQEPSPPQVDPTRGYWIASRRVRVFPHDKLQFERAKVFFNGAKLFSMPLYVVSLNGAFNPAADAISFNSAGGPTINVPFYYMASPRGTGTVYFQRAPSGGFASERPGFALAVDQQYFLSNSSQGRVTVDQLGHGGWNLNMQHKLQLSPTTSASFFLNMPRHRSPFFRTSLLKEMRAMQVGFEGFYARPDGGADSAQGQFFARLRPRQLGRSGWSYTLAANASLLRSTTFRTQAIGGSSGGGFTLPGSGFHLPGDDPQTTLIASRRQRLAQTANISLQAPQFRLWKGASLNASFSGIAFNSSEGERGLSPGAQISLGQNLGRIGALQVDYSYDRSRSSLYGEDYTHFITGSLQLSPLRNLSTSTFLSRSLTDGSVYGSTSMDYYLGTKWRVGAFSDYSSFADVGSTLNYGLTLGRTLKGRELTLNWDNARQRIYFEFGNLSY